MDGGEECHHFLSGLIGLINARTSFGTQMKIVCFFLEVRDRLIEMLK
jgi:hypothetical protein